MQSKPVDSRKLIFSCFDERKKGGYNDCVIYSVSSPVRKRKRGCSINTFDERYTLDTFQRLLAVDSTTGQYQAIQEKAAEIIRDLGFSPQFSWKGGILADLGGEGEPLVITAHLDDIGLMVRHVSADGTLYVCPVCGLYPYLLCNRKHPDSHRGGKGFHRHGLPPPNFIHVTEDELRKVPGDFCTC